MKLRKAKKNEREMAMKTAESQIRDLMKNVPSISTDNLVELTGYSEYIIKRIYMKIRREKS